MPLHSDELTRFGICIPEIFNKKLKSGFASLEFMRKRGIIILLAICSMCTLSIIASAHIPIIPDDGTTLATATEIIDPWKSWFYYSELEAGEVHYYTFEAITNERLRFMLNIPIPEGDRGFNPTFVLMGPGIVDQGTPTVSIETPTGAGVMVVEPASLEPEYEGFTPMSQYMTVDLNMSSPETGTYYIAVYEESTGGRYALVTGYVEAYTLVEWITVPSMVITLLLWSGQNIVFILLPVFVPLVFGVVFLLQREREIFSSSNLPKLLGTLGGLMFLGSSFSFVSQMIYALIQSPPNWTIYASLIFAALPFILAIFTLRTVYRERWEQKRGQLLKLIIISLIAPFVWAGLYIGPILVFLGGLLPLVKSSQQ